MIKFIVKPLLKKFWKGGDTMKIWVFGLYGIVSTTAMTGAKAIEKGKAPKTGLVTELPEFSEEINKTIPFKFKFGGHEIRQLDKNGYEATLYHWNLNRHFDREFLDAVKDDLSEIRAKKGTALNCGSAMEDLGEIDYLEKNEKLTLSDIVDAIEKDIKEFADEDTVAVNVASTEPVIKYDKQYHDRLNDFEKLIKENKKELITASSLYAYVALKNGIPYINFTPSSGASLPALKELAEKNKVPHAGNDGKTGETLAKTTIVPMFKYRNLKVLGWMGYNILGDLDGVVLNHADNKESKIISKDGVLEKILGYSPFTITEINYFPSLQDNKTAFDFIHYEGFMGRKMKFYFIWDGIDAILAAPLVIDLARFILYAKKKGESGVVKELAFFFKSPMDTDVYNTHEQYQLLVEWFNRLKEK